MSKKAYWISIYNKVLDSEKLAAYAALAGPALTAAGGRILARGMPATLHEHGQMQRTVLIEFDSVEACLLYTSPSPRDVEESRMPSSA